MSSARKRKNVILGLNRAPPPLSSYFNHCSRLTVDGEVDPRPVQIRIVALVEEQDRALVPPLVARPYIRDLDGRLSHVPDPPVVRRVRVGGEPGEEREDGRFEALLAPRDDVLDEHGAGVGDVTLENAAAAHRGVLAHGAPVAFRAVALCERKRKSGMNKELDVARSGIHVRSEMIENVI